EDRKPDVTVHDPAVVAESDVQSAFGAPPIDVLVAESVDDDDESLPTDEEQAAVDAYNEVVVLAVVTAWSFGDVTVETILDLPGDAYDILVLRIRELNKPTVAEAE